MDPSSSPVHSHIGGPEAEGWVFWECVGGAWMGSTRTHRRLLLETRSLRRGGATRATGLFLPVASSGARGRAMRAIVICVIVVYTLPRRAKRSESLACTRVTVLLGSDPAS